MSKKGGRRKTDRITDLSQHAKPFVYVRPLADYLDSDPRTIIKMIRDGKLAGDLVGKEWKIPTVAALELWNNLNSRKNVPREAA
jgi:hypothetical protein